VTLLAITGGPSFTTTFASGLQASLQGVTRSQAGAVTTIVSDRIRDISHDWAQGLALSGPTGSWRSPNGVSAGSTDRRWGVWGDASGSFLNDSSSSLGYSGSSVVALSGIDFAYDKNWILGFTAGYNHADVGLRAVPAERVVNGAVVGPYLSYIINSSMAADAQMQYSRLGNDVTVTAPVLTHRFAGDRITGAGNLNIFDDSGPMKLTGFTGYAYTWEGSNAGFLGIPGLANNVRYGVIKLGGEGSYPIGDWEAYLPLTLQYETTTPTDDTGRFSLLLGAGLRYRWGDAVKAGISFTSIEFKSHMQDYRIGANLRVMF
jgi:hypothetical protein